MQWADDGQLRIEIHFAETIALSLHDADGVQITYHVPKLLMSPRFSEGLERQTEEAHAAGRLREADYAARKKMNQGWRQWEEEFIHWASENAIVDEVK
jgi:hypothetical protein